MTNADGGPDAPSGGGLRQRIKSVLVGAERDYSFVRGLTVLSVFGTLIGAYFQNLSAYENKVTAQAQTDMAAATQTFTDASTALAIPLNLQWRLINDYHNAIMAGTDADATGYEMRNAREIYTTYIKAYDDLSQNYNLLARKVELYIDMASNLDPHPRSDETPLLREIDMARLNAYGFDCEENMPSFNKQARDKNGKEEDESKISLKNPDNGKILPVDWYSAKHHVLTIETCFEINHRAMTAVHQWASGSTVEPAQKNTFMERNFKILHTRASNLVLRLNSFMSLAMFDINKIRIKYRPNGFICSVPGLSLFGNCTPVPVKTAGPLGKSGMS
jgi:hypothetical protein